MTSDHEEIALFLTYLAMQFYFFEKDHVLELVEFGHVVGAWVLSYQLVENARENYCFTHRPSPGNTFFSTQKRR